MPRPRPAWLLPSEPPPRNGAQALLHALHEGRRRWCRRSGRSRHSRSFGRRHWGARNFARPLSGKPHAFGRRQCKFLAVALPILPFYTNRKAGILDGLALRLAALRELHFLQQHRGVTLQVALDVRSFVVMVALAPDEDAEAVEIVRLVACPNRGPQ